MAFSFIEQDIEIISNILGQKPEVFENSWTWNLQNDITDKPMIINLYNSINFDGDKEGSIISVQTRHGYYELHNITNYIVFEPDEIIFICSKKKTLSCLIVGKGNTCSFFANIQKKMLRRDPTELDPAVLLAVMQLSLIENKSL
jgi:hypothetical protein